MGIQKAKPKKRILRINLATLQHVPYQRRKITFNPFHERKEYPGTINSISANGLFIKTEQIPQRGCNVFLNFSIQNRRVKCMGKVTSIKENKGGVTLTGFGVRFTQITDLDFQSIKRSLLKSFKPYRKTL